MKIRKFLISSTKSWIKKTKKNLEKCQEILSFEKTQHIYLTLNIDHLVNNTINELNESQIETLMMVQGATHAVELETKIKKQHILINPKPLNLGKEEKERLKKLKKIKLKKNKALFKDSKASFYKVKIANNLPNALMIGGTTKEITNRLKDEEVFERKEPLQKSSLPQIVSSISITTIPNSQGFEQWDSYYRWFPLINFSLFDSEYTYSFIKEEELNGREDEIFTYRVNMFSVAPMIAGEASYFWPLGVTFFQGGLGVGFYTLQDDFGAAQGISGVISLGFGHRFFISDRFFVHFAFYFDDFNPGLIDNPIFKSTGYSYTTLSIGYHFPEVRSVLR